MIEAKVQKLISRFAELEAKLGHPEVFSDQKKYRELAQEHAYLSEVKKIWEALQNSRRQIVENQEMLSEENDPEFAAVLREDLQKLQNAIPLLEQELEKLLVPPNPDDSKNVILEIRAGTGGDEAALFVGDCVRMYKMFADKHHWKYELLSCTHSDLGGFREYVMTLSGSNVHRLMIHEGGTHRVQRIPETEAQGRVHTSAITVAVLKEPDEDCEVVIDEKDLRVDTYRSSGAGGQHVNTTDSAVRLTHMPTGVVVYCQEERSQHKNKERAMRLLKARIAEAELEKKNEAIASTRAAQVGSGDRSERIRTYNFPQNRVTDHRIDLTLYNLDQVMEGQLDKIVDGLVTFFHKQQLQQ